MKLRRLGHHVHEALMSRLMVRAIRPRLDRALASITFDDIPVSAATVGARILDEAGASGSFYVCGGKLSQENAGMPQASLEQVAELHARGHEIGCHTFLHPDASAIPADDFIADIRRNLEYFAESLPSARLDSFAYPYGASTFATKARSSRLFQTCRGTVAGLNCDIADLAELRSVILTDLHFNEQDILDWIAAANAANAWLIFFTHDVSDTPSEWGCRPEQLRFVIEALKSSAVEIVTVAAGAERFTRGARPRPRLLRRRPPAVYSFPPGRMPIPSAYRVGTRP